MEKWKKSSGNCKRIIALIACSKTKLNKRAPAYKLYQGALFKKSYRYCISKGYDIFVLSAEYGLIHSTSTIDPYDKTLNEMNKNDSIIWSKNVSIQLSKLKADKFVIFAGRNYYKYLKFNKNTEVDIPQKGMPFGKRLQWLNRQLIANQMKGFLCQKQK